MDGVINKDIQIENIEAKMASTGNMKYILKDQNGDKYFFWQKNKGQDSDVFLSFTGMELKKGNTCHIGYTEKEESFVNNEGKTINYKDRFILGLRESNGQPSITPSQPKSLKTEANRGQYGENKEAFGRRLAIHGMVNGLLAGGIKPEEINLLTLNQLIALENLIGAVLNEPSAKSEMRAKFGTPVETNNEQLPVIQQNEDIAPDIAELAKDMEADSGLNVEDIPF